MCRTNYIGNLKRLWNEFKPHTDMAEHDIALKMHTIIITVQWTMITV